MRLPCEIIFTKLNSQKREVTSKSKKGFAVLNKLKQDPPLYYLTFPVANDKSKDVYKLEVSKPPVILTPRKSEGKVTFRFGNCSVFISKAIPEKLDQFLKLIKEILAGKSIDIENIKIKSTDFKPNSIHIRSQSEYRSQISNCSDFLKSLKIDPISLKMPDSEWKKCRNLTNLSLNGNPIGSNKKNLDVLSELNFLAVLELRDCQLGSVSMTNLFKLFGSLRESVTVLDISENSLPVFPPIFHLKRLRTLNISKNRLKYIPSRIGFFRSLDSIDMSNNLIRSLPHVFSSLPNISNVAISSNEHVVRQANEIGEPITRRCFSKVDREDYRHVGGVDTLRTIAANVLHRNPLTFNASRPFLPISLRFQVDDLLTTPARISALEMCTMCCRLRHIRYVRPIFVPSQRIASQVDISGRFVVFNQLYCIDCHRPPRNETIPNDPHFFRFSI